MLNNRDLNQVTWEERIEGGDPRMPLTQAIPDFPYASFADLVGLTGIRVDRPEDVGRAIEQALSASTPVVLDVYTDPNIPTIPPHITFEQAKMYSTVFIEGRP